MSSTVRKAPITAIVPSLTDDIFQSGLLMCSSNGNVRFWDNLSFDIEKFIETTIPLENGDFITHLMNCEPAGFIIGTHHRQLFKAILYTQESRPQIALHAIKEPVGILQSFGFSKQSTSSSGTLVSLACGQETDGKYSRDLYVMTEKYLEKWSASRIHPDKKILNVDILSLIKESLSRNFNILVPTVRLIDIAYAKYVHVFVFFNFLEMILLLSWYQLPLKTLGAYML